MIFRSKHIDKVVRDQQLRWKECQERQRILRLVKAVPPRLKSSLQKCLGLYDLQQELNDILPGLRMGIALEPKMVPPGLKSE